MTDLDLAYIAGLFDGEGSVMILKKRDGRRLGSLPGVYYLHIAVTNTYRLILTMLKEAFGGHIAWRENPAPRSRKPCGHWSLSSRKAADFLRQILPYMKIKADEAALGLRFQDLLREYRLDARQGPGRRSAGRCPLTAETLADRELMRAKLRLLHTPSPNAKAGIG